MKLIDNVSQTLKDDLKVEIKKGSKDGNKIFAQASIPLVATAEYLEGFMAIKMINKRIKIPNTK